MTRKFTLTAFLLFSFLFLTLSSALAQSPTFSQSDLNFNGVGDVSNGVTSLMYGPDGRLYVAEYPGLIKVLTVQRNSATDYEVTAIETLNGIQAMSDHNDDGTAHSSTERETTGLTVAGTASNPIIYVTSSDFRIGSGVGGGNGDVDLDTNSGVITRFTWNGASWDVVDLVRGLPRSEENHATNGLELATINGTDYLIVAQGGHTNGGGPSANFVYHCEYALSGAILSVDLDAINALPILNDNGRSYIYDLPTLDDPTRANVNGITDPDAIGYNGIDINDPWGGNDGLNQAVVVPGGPVQIFSPGYRNAYDLTITQSGALYVTDNGANQGWGGFPVNEGGGSATNAYDPAEPGSQSASGGEQINNEDHLQLVTTNIQTYTPGSYYGGHPNPTRANPTGAGLYTAPGLTGNAGAVFRTLTYDPDGSTAGSTNNANIALPANWPPVATANTDEGDWRGPGLPNPDGPVDGEVTIWTTNTNGMDEYTASNFGGAMQGDLVAGHHGGNIHRVQLNANGSLQTLSENFFSGIGGNALGVTCNSDTDNFPGTVWTGTLNGKIVVFEPQDFICIDPGQPGYDANADYDNDGYTNQDEEDNGTDPCNGGSQPDDFDKAAGGTLVSDLNDTDDDADGIPDATDPFQLGNPTATGSDAFTIPISNGLFNDQQGLGGIFGLGMTGLMNNGNTGPNWLDWLDVKGGGPNPNDVLGGAPGLMTSHMTDGTALGTTNTQDKAYQYGVQTDTGTGSFTVSGNLIDLTGPLRIYGNTAAVGGELGHFIGDGTQSNYIKIVLTANGITALQEINDVPQTPITIPISVPNRPANGIVFYFVVDPSNGQVVLEYSSDGGTRTNIGTITAQGSILTAIQQVNQDLAVGFIGTSNTAGVELEGTWDFLNVTQDETPNPILAINAGGPSIVQNSTTFMADQNFVGGSPYTNSSALLSDIYKTERSSSAKAFQYNIPLDNGDYTVVLHFAEIYWGATGGGPGGNNLRVFDVSIEDDLVLDNYDIFSEVGAEVAQEKSFDVNVNDGFLTVDFSSLAADGGVDQPKVSVIEIFSFTNNQAPLANAEADLTFGEAPLNINFTGENSSDDKSVTSYFWDFGDGNTSSAQNPEHTFTTQGIYNVSLTVEDEEGLSNTDSLTITVNGQNAEVIVSGELKKWHPVNLLFTGPETSENDAANPFLDYRLNVVFTSPTGKQYVIPGFYAADGNSAETSATSGNKWMVRFSPDEIGEWTYTASFRTGPEIAVSLVESEGTPISFDGVTGTVDITSSDKTFPDNRSQGLLEYVDERYLKFRETGKYFLKAGSDSPENFLAYADFDNTLASKDWSPHIQDWNSEDPIWKSDKGMGVIGAINYLSDKGMNAFSFLTMNVIGDGKDVWPWAENSHSDLDGNSQTEIDNRLRYDVSKLEQWEKVFEHSDSKGMFMNFKTQETENDQLLDGGQLGVQRKLYYRELIARFGHHLALNWNLGEEYDIYGELSDSQNLILKEYIDYVDSLDAYDHPIVVHSYPFAQGTLYNTLLGPTNKFTGPSLQSFIDDIHDDVVKWIQDSDDAGRKWVVANDEQGGPERGVTADSDYTGDKGTEPDNRSEVRNKALWGTLMGGGAGVEYYFGYSTGETDLSAQDFRSRAHKWEDAKVALDFFDQHVPYWRMQSDDQLISIENGYCLAEPDENYLIYLPSYEATTLDLSTVNGSFSVEWFDPENGGVLQNGSTDIVVGGSPVDIGSPPNSSNTDWVVWIKKIPIETKRINAGGPELTINGQVFESDGFFVGGVEFSNSNALVPELHKTERSSVNNEFSYEVPVADGNYLVKLHFAEIYFGATGGVAGDIESRVFDVLVEGETLLDDYDIIEDAGLETEIIKSFEVLIEDGSLSLVFDSLGDDGVYQPKLSAFEIIGPIPYPSITVADIDNQVNVVGDEVGSLGVNASGGNPDVNFNYSISGQPDGIDIEPTNGLIFGSLEPSASTGGVNEDGLHQVAVVVEKIGSSPMTLNFAWEVNGTLEWVNKNENQNYTARHENSFVQAGDKFYLMGGRENSRNIDIYDYASDTWSTLVDSAPFEFNHFQATEYQGLIWVIGAFQSNAFPNEVPAEYVWAFDPANEEWIQGGIIPQNRRRGSAGLVVYNDKFYIVGGNTDGHNGGYIPYLDEYNPASGVWTPMVDAPRSRDHFAATLIDDKIYIAGGRLTGGAGGVFGPVIPEVDIYDFSSGIWSTLPSSQNIPTSRGGASAANFNGKLVVIGGEVENEDVYGVSTTGALNITEEYDPNTQTWSRISDLNSPRHGTQAIVSGAGLFTLAGSPNLGGGNQKNMEVLGADNPLGNASIASDLSAPQSVVVAETPGTDIILEVANGNQAIIINSFEIIGVDAEDFSTEANEPQSRLIKSESSLTMNVRLVNPGPNKTANLVINYGADSEIVITLLSEPTGCNGSDNVALGKPSSQSSQYGGGLASYANDGNLTGDNPWGGGANLQHTTNESQPWWQVDLGDVYALDRIDIHNRTSGLASIQGRLNDFYVLISDSPFPAGATLGSLLGDGSITNIFFDGDAGLLESLPISADGRYVRLQLSGSGILHMAEVEVYGCPTGPDPCDGIEVSITDVGPLLDTDPVEQLSATPVGGSWSGDVSAGGSFDPSQGPGTYTAIYTYTEGACTKSDTLEITVTSESMGCDGSENLALSMLSSQSSQYGGGLASYANDGSSTGDNPWGGGANLQHTTNESQPWWQVDLGDVYTLDRIDIHNRTSGLASIQGRLNDFYVLISDSPFPAGATLGSLLGDGSITNIFFDGDAGLLESLPISADGRYVRLQLSGSGILHMAEVEVYGCPTGPDPCDGIEVSITDVGPLLDTDPVEQLSATPVGGSWSGDVSAGGSFDPSQGPGTYTAIYTYTEGACTKSDTLEITVTSESMGCDGSENLALSMLSSQSSQYGGGLASYANDGSSTGDNPWGGGANLQHTTNESQPWWQVDLGDVYTLDRIDIHNRTSGLASIQGRLNDFYVLISDSPFPAGATLGSLLGDGSITNIFFDGDAGLLESFPMTVDGRYVRVQLSGSGILHMAEVEVYGCSISSSAKSYVRSKPNLMNVTPNPVNTVTTLTFDKPVELETIQVFDVMGRLIKTYDRIEVADDGEYLLDVHAIPAGTYFLKSYDTEGIQYQKALVIKK